MPLAVAPPLPPMLAQLSRELPVGPDLSYEPKWDGFRCLAFRDGDDVLLLSRNDRPLTRYFPEVVAGLRALPADVVLDGELLAHREGRAEFSALMARLHPSATRVALLAQETPATYVAFDLLGDGPVDLRTHGYADRRRRLESLLAQPPAPLCLTPTTRDPETARDWLSAGAGSGIDGVVVKADGQAYEPGRRAMVKVKTQHTVDCVVAGLRPMPDGTVSSLLLGLWDDEVLRHVGVVAQLSRALRSSMRDELLPLVAPLETHPWREGFALEGGALGRLKGTAGRWTPDMPRDWVPLRPDRVAEVTYDALEGLRFRHPARFLRWRPDRDAASCTVEQLA